MLCSLVLFCLRLQICSTACLEPGNAFGRDSDLLWLGVLRQGRLVVFFGELVAVRHILLSRHCKRSWKSTVRNRCIPESRFCWDQRGNFCAHALGLPMRTMSKDVEGTQGGQRSSSGLSGVPPTHKDCTLNSSCVGLHVSLRECVADPPSSYSKTHATRIPIQMMMTMMMTTWCTLLPTSHVSNAKQNIV